MKSDKNFENGEYVIYEGTKYKKLGTEYYMTNPPKYLGSHWLNENNVVCYFKNVMMKEVENDK